MKKKLLATGILLALAGTAHAASFDIPANTLSTTAQTLAAGQSGTIDGAGTLQVSGSTVAITVTGSSSITNNGILDQIGSGRAIRDNTGGLTLTVTNGVGAVMETADNDVIQMNKANSNVTFYNSGKLISNNASLGGAQAIDFNAITTGSNVLYNYATGDIEAYEADAVRPGVNGFVYNDGLIKSTNAPGSTDGSDGIDAQTNSGITIVNATTGSDTVAGTGTIEGARHGITGGNTDVTTSGAYTLSVTNNLGGTIQGDDGSGINIDGFNANEVVTVVNHGTITGNGVTGDGDGVDVDGLVNLTNTGTIKSLHAYNDTSEGVTVGGGTITNSGTIEGDNLATNGDGTANSGTGRGITLAGVDKDPTTGAPIATQGIYADTTITNTGLIRGQSDSAIAVTGAANAFKVTIINYAGGVLEGGGTAAAVYTGGNNATIVNYGTITADSSNVAVDLGSGNSSLQILGGSAQVNGNINGGTGTSTVEIDPGQNNTFTYAGALSNVSQLTIGTGGQGTVVLNGASTYSGDTVVWSKLVLGNSSAVGTGTLNLLGATAVYTNGIHVANGVNLDNGGTIEVDGSDTATQSGAITWSTNGGAEHYNNLLDKTGTGTLVLAATTPYTGGVTISSGTLQANASSLQGNITDNASLVFDQASDGSFTGTIGGTGTLNKIGAGNLTLVGANTYTGGTLISAGTLQGDSSSLQGAITNNASLVFDQSSNGSFAGSIGGTGALTKIGGGTLTLAGANTYSGGTVITAGALQGDTNSLQGNITDNAALVFNQGSDGVYAGVLSGNGALTKAGAGTLVLNGTNSFSGTTDVQAGTLEVGDASNASATLGGNVQVDAGAALRGHGTIAGNVTNNGALQPGGSIGTLTIQGNYTQGANGSLVIDASPSGQADLLAIDGKANIAGSTVVVGTNGNWAARTDYTILTATQGVSGQFASASSNLAFLTPVLGYSASSVTLSLQRNDVNFASVAATPNERATAGAVEALGFNNALYNAVLLTDAATARTAFNQLSGEIYASTRTALMDDSRHVRDAINDHLLGMDNRTSGTSATDDSGVSAWTSGWGHWGDRDGDSNASRLAANGSGLLVGADMPVGSTVRIGAVAGFGEDSASIDEGSSSHATNTHLGFYGGLHVDAFQLQGAVAYTWHTVDTHRPVTFDDLGRYDSEYDANTAQAYVDASYAFGTATASWAPFLNVAHVRLHTDAASEDGGIAALDAGAQTDSSTYATLGLRGVFALDADGGLRAHLGLGWQHGWGDIGTSSTMRFASGNVAYSVDGVPVARNAAAFDGGLSFAVARNVTVDASYNGQFASHATDQGARLSLTWVF